MLSLPLIVIVRAIDDHLSFVLVFAMTRNLYNNPFPSNACNSALDLIIQEPLYGGLIMWI